jgi:hypothetical protein
MPISAGTSALFSEKYTNKRKEGSNRLVIADSTNK